MRHGRRILAIVMAAVLAVGLWPGAAMADVRSASIAASSAGGLQVQATTRTVNGVTLEQNSGVWTITGYSGSATSLNLNSLGVGVITAIGDSAFNGCTTLRSVTLPSTLQTIGRYSFEGCTALQSIALPESLVSIGRSAFRNCTSLSSITVRSRDLGVDSDGVFANAGSGASSGIAVTFASTCKSVPYHFFRQYRTGDGGVANVVKATVEAGVAEIGNAAFQGCSNLKSVTLGSGVTAINEYAFEGCSSLSAFTLPSTLQSIGRYAFQGCISWKTLTLPANLTFIGRSAFRNCTSLSSITVRSLDLGVDSDGVFANAGSGASSGIAVTFASTCKSVPYHFFRQYRTGDGGVANVKKVTLASGVAGIGNAAFQGCAALTSVSLPNSLTSIGEYAFCDCSSLKSLRIPPNVSADNLGYRYAYLNLGLKSKITATTGDQYKKLRKNSDYITTTRTTVVLASDSLYRAKVSSISNKPYTGKKITPSPVVKMGSKKLKKGTDYTLSYKDNKNLGIATITVKGKGKYVGTKTATFKIVPAKVTGVKAKSSYSGNLTVSWSTKMAEKAGAGGYRVYWKVAGKKKANYSDISWNRYSSTTLYSLPKGKNVTVKVQAYTYINGKKVYGPWSASKTAKVKK